MASDHPYDLSGRVALITGANHGIGAATARLLARRGAAVVITYLRTGEHHDHPPAYQENRRADGHHVAREIVAAGGRAHAIEADLLDAEVIPRLFAEAERVAGPVEILVNNATGQVANDSFGEHASVALDRAAPVTARVFDVTFGVDARAGALLIAEFARRHLARGATWGRVIGLTSGGRLGFPGEVTYGAAKAALENYTMSAAAELGGAGITANMIHPPVTDTGWVTQDVIDFVAASDEHVHVAVPDDVAAVIGFLCSPDAAMISGNILRMR